MFEITQQQLATIDNHLKEIVKIIGYIEGLHDGREINKERFVLINNELIKQDEADNGR